MYYYIFDIKKCKKKSQVEAIKDYLVGLGISGEFTFISAVQNAEELTELGLKRGYSTIVAVGADDLINSVANKMIGRPEAMGVIPLQASNPMLSLLGSTDWKEAAETLRFRRIREMNIGKTASGEHFLTHLKLGLKNPMEITLEFKDFIVQAWVKNLIIANHHPEIEKLGPEFLDVVIESTKKDEGSIFKLLKSIVSPKIRTNGKNMSLIRARSLRLFSKKPIPLMAENKIIAKTPQLVETSDEILRIIVSKSSK